MAKTLIIRTSALGDIAMLVPIVASVASKYPQDRFTVMTRAAYIPLFTNLGFNINVVGLDLKKKHSGILGFFRVLQKSLNYSHVADEHDVLRSKVLRWTLRLFGKKVAHIDKGRDEKKNAIDNKVLAPPLKSSFERYFDVFNKLGFKAELNFTDFFAFTPRVFSDLAPVITNEKQGKWIGIAPFSKHEGKVYPEAKMEKVVEMLSKQDDTSIFLFGAGKKEKAILDKWASAYPNVSNLTGKLKLGKEILLISYLDVMVSMDSANMHLASLVNVPVASIWGATHPAMGFYGFRQNPANAIQIDLECRPCSVYGNKPCENEKQYACLNDIPETVVVDKINEILSTSNT